MENEIKEMREDYAKKKSDMLEKTRLVINSQYMLRYSMMLSHTFPSVQEGGGIGSRRTQETPRSTERTQER